MGVLFYGVIYILTNKSFPKYVKIGYADNLENRLRSLNRSECVPFAFEVYAWYDTTERPSDIAVHRMIDAINPNLRAIDSFNGGGKRKRKREFYEMTPEVAYGIFSAIATASNTETSLHKKNNNEQILTSPKSKTSKPNKSDINANRATTKENFSFIKCGIPMGAELTFYRDPNIKAYVKDETHVEYEGQLYTTSGLAKKVLNNRRPIQGPSCWKYKDELLTKIRERREKNGTYN